MSVPSVDAIVLKLIDVASAALPDVQVLDGRSYAKDLDKHVLLVGYSGRPSDPVATVDRSIEDGSPTDTLFVVTVRCVVAVWSGDEEFTKKRAAAQSTVTSLNDTLESNVQLDGTAYQAWMSEDQQWFQVADTEGNSVECEFAVSVEVFA